MQRNGRGLVLRQQHEQLTGPDRRRKVRLAELRQVKRPRAPVQEAHLEPALEQRDRAAEASEPRSTEATKARIASIRSIVADSAISPCG